jgi:hypothetical protein
MLLMAKSAELCSFFLNEIAKKKEKSMGQKRASVTGQSMDEIEEIMYSAAS